MTENTHSTAKATKHATKTPSRPYLVIDASDPLDPPCTATAGEAADALQMDVDAVLWAIEEHGRCDGAAGLLVVSLDPNQSRDA